MCIYIYTYICIVAYIIYTSMYIYIYKYSIYSYKSYGLKSMCILMFLDLQKDTHTHTQLSVWEISAVRSGQTSCAGPGKHEVVSCCCFYLIYGHLFGDEKKQTDIKPINFYTFPMFSPILLFFPKLLQFLTFQRNKKKKGREMRNTWRWPKNNLKCCQKKLET